MEIISNIVETTSAVSESQKEKIRKAFSSAIKKAAAEMCVAKKPSLRVIAVKMLWLEPVDYEWFEIAREHHVGIEVHISSQEIRIIISK